MYRLSSKFVIHSKYPVYSLGIWLHGSEEISGQCDDSTHVQSNFYAGKNNVLPFVALLPPKIGWFGHFQVIFEHRIGRVTRPILARGIFSHCCAAFGHSCLRYAVGNSLGEGSRHEASPRILKNSSTWGNYIPELYNGIYTVYIH